MKVISNRLFRGIVVITLCVCLVVSVICRFTVRVYSYEDIENNAGKYIYNFFEDAEYANIFLYDYDLLNIDMTLESDYIIRGKITGNHEVLQRTVKTEIEVLDEIKGDYGSRLIYVYEPFEIFQGQSEFILTYDGYNLLKEDKEYVLCLADFPEENAFIYVTPLLAKFPVIYTEKDFLVLPLDDYETFSNIYADFSSYELIFSSEDEKKAYFMHYEYLID